MGANKEKLLSAVGVDTLALLDRDKRISVDALLRLYELADIQTNSPDIGLYVGRVAFTNNMNLQLYMSTICRSLREYLNLIPSTLKFFGDIGEVHVHPEEDVICLQWKPLVGATNQQRYLVDTILVFASMIVNSLCIRPISLQKIKFSYPKPDDICFLTEIFGNNLLFNQPSSGIYYSRKVLDYPVIHLDNELARPLADPLQHLFSGNHSEDDLLIALRLSITKLLPSDEMTIDKVAGDLCVSKRTLQRRLSVRDKQFLQVLQCIREELAMCYLSDNRLSLTDISLLLGYTDHSSFSSVFKSWTGQSPRDFRAK